MMNNQAQDNPVTIRDSADRLEKTLFEAHSVLDSLIGATMSEPKGAEKQSDGSVCQLTYKCQTNCALAANLVSRLNDLRDRI